MIDVAIEQVISLSEAADFLPRRRAGKKTSVVTLYRWTNQGLRGVRFEFVMVGATRCTSREALQRFCDALTAAVNGRVPVPPSRLTKSRERQIEAAERRLAKKWGAARNQEEKGP
jgi:hypothetical protein